jgi:hypothetical protein
LQRNPFATARRSSRGRETLTNRHEVVWYMLNMIDNNFSRGCRCLLEYLDDALSMLGICGDVGLDSTIGS